MREGGSGGRGWRKPFPKERRVREGGREGISQSKSGPKARWRVEGGMDLSESTTTFFGANFATCFPFGILKRGKLETKTEKIIEK